MNCNIKKTNQGVYTFFINIWQHIVLAGDYKRKMAKDNKVLQLDSIIQSIIIKDHLYSSPYWCYGCSKYEHDRVLVPKTLMFLLSDKENNQECTTIPWMLMTPQDEQQLACCSNQKCLFYQNWAFSPHFQLYFCLCVV